MSILAKRRALIIGAGAALGTGLAGANWKTLSTAAGYQGLLDFGDDLNKHAQRIALLNRPLAREYRTDQISKSHPAKGGFGASYIDPDRTYATMVANGFKDWRFKVVGLVQTPQEFTLPQIHAMPSRTQITMHCCDEGWSAIGQWTGVPLAWLLSKVGVLPEAKYVVFHAMDKVGGVNLFDSLDMIDAIHPQTILAHGFNGETLPPGHGAPLRLRMELQLGYKNLKHLNAIELVDSLANVGGGTGGLFQQYGYQRYVGL
jgi:DMSO/TMAO reductase YedYZ molybdopterin-dependent catalytic subunit